MDQIFERYLMNIETYREAIILWHQPKIGYSHYPNNAVFSAFYYWLKELDDLSWLVTRPISDNDILLLKSQIYRLKILYCARFKFYCCSGSFVYLPNRQLFEQYKIFKKEGYLHAYSRDH